MARGRTTSVLTTRWDGGEVGRLPDRLIVEEPLEIRLDGHLVATTMRTPGDDFELAVGFCFTEGLLAGASVRACRYCVTDPAVEQRFNVVTVDTGGRAPVPVARLGTTTSSCGACGSRALDELAARLDPLPGTEPFPGTLLASLPARLRAHQPLFDATGAVHAAGAVGRDGSVLVVREDVGRHNAVDKVVGRLLLDGRLPATGAALAVSGRASFELVQKAWSAGFPALVAVSAPSSLAVQAATRAGMALVGFARDGRLNLYAGEVA
jgi:FdhD protein